jgi:hypothetical protein
MTDKPFNLIKDTHWADMRAIPAIIAEYERRIEELEENNLIMAEQLKKREGMWWAPMELDEEMFNTGEQYMYGMSDLNKAYEVMRDNWLRRQK